MALVLLPEVLSKTVALYLAFQTRADLLHLTCGPEAPQHRTNAAALKYYFE